MPFVPKMYCPQCGEHIPEPKATEQRNKGFVCCSKKCGMKYQAYNEMARLGPKLIEKPKTKDQHAWIRGKLKSIQAGGDIDSTKTATCTTT